MSPKITSKNLSYDDSVPPFLAALRAQAAGARGPDPLLAAQRRSAKKRSGSEEAEDAPLVVDEEGNVVDVEVDKDGVVTDSKEQDADAQQGFGPIKEVKKDVEGKAAIGGRKRKVRKVIGETADATASKRGARGTTPEQKAETKERKPKKKAKKIKLSFDEDEG